MNVTLRPITKDDYELMLKWRNDPEIMKGCYTQKDGHIITWDEHMKWLESRNQYYHIYMIYAGESDDSIQRVGILALSQLDSSEPEMSSYIGEKSVWGKGISKEVLRQAFDILRSMGYQYNSVTILNDNERSIHNAEILGYKKIGEARPGESLWMLKL